jgi:hypothetical protein
MSLDYVIHCQSLQEPMVGTRVRIIVSVTHRLVVELSYTKFRYMDLSMYEYTDISLAANYLS